jgi:hypothetical protein
MDFFRGRAAVGPSFNLSGLAVDEMSALALNGRGDTHQICPLLKVNRPYHLAAVTSQFDPMLT